MYIQVYTCMYTCIRIHVNLVPYLKFRYLYYQSKARSQWKIVVFFIYWYRCQYTAKSCSTSTLIKSTFNKKYLSPINHSARKPISYNIITGTGARRGTNSSTNSIISESVLQVPEIGV